MADRDTGTQHKLRLPVELKEKIAESAKAHNRSMNADIVARLQDSLRTFPSLYFEKSLCHISTEEMLSELMRRYDDAEMVLTLERKIFDE